MASQPHNVNKGIPDDRVARSTSNAEDTFAQSTIWKAVLAEKHYLSLMVNELSLKTIHLSLLLLSRQKYFCQQK